MKPSEVRYSEGPSTRAFKRSIRVSCHKDVFATSKQSLRTTSQQVYKERFARLFNSEAMRALLCYRRLAPFPQNSGHRTHEQLLAQLLAQRLIPSPASVASALQPPAPLLSDYWTPGLDSPSHTPAS